MASIINHGVNGLKSKLEAELPSKGRLQTPPEESSRLNTVLIVLQGPGLFTALLEG